MKTQLSKSLFTIAFLACTIFFGVSAQTAHAAAILRATPATIAGDYDISTEGISDSGQLSAIRVGSCGKIWNSPS